MICVMIPVFEWNVLVVPLHLCTLQRVRVMCLTSGAVVSILPLSGIAPECSVSVLRSHFHSHRDRDRLIGSCQPKVILSDCVLSRYLLVLVPIILQLISANWDCHIGSHCPSVA